MFVVTTIGVGANERAHEVAVRAAQFDTVCSIPEQWIPDHAFGFNGSGRPGEWCLFL
jgi:hypothetical protein